MKMINKVIFVMAGLLMLSACGTNSGGNQDPSTLNVMILSEIPLNYQSSFNPYVEELISDVNNEDLDVNVSLFLVSHDKLAIEIVAREVDVFVLDESLKHIIMDPYGLHPLDELIDILPETPPYEEYIMRDEETGSHHLYAVPLDNDSTFVRDLGVELPSNLIAVVVKTSPHKEIGVHLIEKLL
ncbi:hypothetical protein [Evansella tamaricis]|uniref:Uncharacterized protein n=1 Tax=Evansella tamaricis TaxID=2069301 RepID=A0ABS6JH14_9BACI|nr:hypothetical protein [Evansella tamaricis]MBU9712967.1 hypothetical protein [Evansella tamaricis]